MFYLPQWSVLPKQCNPCRLLELDLTLLFEKFLDREIKLGTRCRTAEDKHIFAEREHLRARVQDALRRSACTPGQLYNICVKDQELTRLALRLLKEKQQIEHPRIGARHSLPKSLGRFLQGGAPGLGKKS